MKPNQLMSNYRRMLRLPLRRLLLHKLHQMRMLNLLLQLQVLQPSRPLAKEELLQVRKLALEILQARVRIQKVPLLQAAHLPAKRIQQLKTLSQAAKALNLLLRAPRVQVLRLAAAQLNLSKASQLLPLVLQLPLTHLALPLNLVLLHRLEPNHPLNLQTAKALHLQVIAINNNLLLLHLLASPPPNKHSYRPKSPV